MLRYIFTILLIFVIIPVGTIYRQNIEEWATGRGLDRLIADGSSILETNPWGPPLLALFFMLTGSTLSLWLNHWFRKRFPTRFSTDLEEVKGQTFRHAEVVIDGKDFVECRFEGVTLVYNGTAPFGFRGNTFGTEFSIRIDDEAALMGVELTRLSQQLNIPLIFEDRGEPVSVIA